MNSSELFDERVTPNKEKESAMKIAIRNELDKLTHARVGDAISIQVYEAYYGSNVNGRQYGKGLLRLNDSFTVETEWRNGVIHGACMVFDVTRNRIVASMDIANGIVTDVQDVNELDTIKLLQKRKQLYEGEQKDKHVASMTSMTPVANKVNKVPMNAKDTEDVPNGRKRKKRGLPIQYENNVLPVSVCNVSILDNSTILENLNSQMEILSIGRNCAPSIKSELILKNMFYLRELFIGQGSCRCFLQFQLIDIPNLEKIIIENDCFSVIELGNDVPPLPKEFILKNLPSFHSLIIGNSSFMSYFCVDITNCPLLSTFQIDCHSFSRAKEIIMNNIPNLTELVFLDHTFEFVDSLLLSDVPSLNTLIFGKWSLINLVGFSFDLLLKLETLRMETNGLFSLVNVRLHDLPFLKMFRCGPNGLFGVQNIEFHDLPSMQRIECGKESFRHCYGLSIRNCPNLRIISVTERCFQGKSSNNDDSDLVLYNLPSLQWFSVGSESMKQFHRLSIRNVVLCNLSCIRVSETALTSIRNYDDDGLSSIIRQIHSNRQ